MALTIAMMDLCEKKELQNETVLMFLMQLRSEMEDSFANNRVPGIDLDRLNARQRNALQNWVYWQLDDKINEINKNMKESI